MPLNLTVWNYRLTESLTFFGIISPAAVVVIDVPVMSCQRVWFWLGTIDVLMLYHTGCDVRPHKETTQGNSSNMFD